MLPLHQSHMVLTNSLAGPVGIEPTNTGLEPAMIPFHHVPMAQYPGNDPGSSRLSPSMLLHHNRVEEGGIEPLPEGPDLQSGCHIQDDFPLPWSTPRESNPVTKA